MSTEKKDLRVQRTLQTIWSAFESLLLEKEYEKITVTELCTRAKINRKTFYNYYGTLDSLLAEYQRTYYQEYIEYWKSFGPCNDFQDIRSAIGQYYEYVSKQNRTYEKIMSTIPSKSIGIGIVDKVMECFWAQSDYGKKYTSFYVKLISNFWTTTVLDIYKAWLDSGKEIPLEDIKVTAQELVVAGLENFEQNAPLSALREPASNQLESNRSR